MAYKQTCLLIMSSVLMITIVISVLLMVTFTTSFNTNTNPEKIKINEENEDSERKWLMDLIPSTVTVNENNRYRLSFEDLTVVTFFTSDHFAEAIRSCDSFQNHPDLKTTKFIAYFSDDISDLMTQAYQKLCPVAKIERLNISRWPRSFRDLFTYKFKAVYQAIALKNRKMILGVDSSVRFNSNFSIKDLIENTIKHNPLDVTMFSKNPFNINNFAVTDQRMYEFFPTIKPEDTKELIQYQAGLVFWVGSTNGWKAMNRYLDCALKRNCMAPPGTTRFCDMKKLLDHPKSYAGCHRFDQSALNLILLEESNNNPSMFQRNNKAFSVERM